MREKLDKVYVPHRFLSSEGTPDFESIFEKGKSGLWFGQHFNNEFCSSWGDQPDIIKNDEIISRHFNDCDQCRDKIKLGKIQSAEQVDLPL